MYFLGFLSMPSGIQYSFSDITGEFNLSKTFNQSFLGNYTLRYWARYLAPEWPYFSNPIPIYLEIKRCSILAIN